MPPLASIAPIIAAVATTAAGVASMAKGSGGGVQSSSPPEKTSEWNVPGGGSTSPSSSSYGTEAGMGEAVRGGYAPSVGMGMGIPATRGSTVSDGGTSAGRTFTSDIAVPSGMQRKRTS